MTLSVMVANQLSEAPNTIEVKPVRNGRIVGVNPYTKQIPLEPTQVVQFSLFPQEFLSITLANPRKESCWIKLDTQGNFELVSNGQPVQLTKMWRSNGTTVMEIPSGTPSWELRINQPAPAVTTMKASNGNSGSTSGGGEEPIVVTQDNVTVGDGPPSLP